MMDRRDRILERLFELLSGLTVTLTTGNVTFADGHIVRNRDELPADKVPGIILLDADEVRDPRVPEIAGRELRPGPTLMRMTPEIYVALDVRKPANKDVGKDLNTARAALLKLVLHDTMLQKIVGANGSISYDGCVTDLARNRVMKGQMGLSITFVYPFIPDEFALA